MLMSRLRRANRQEAEEEGRRALRVGALVWSDVLAVIETATHAEGVDTGPVQPWTPRQEATAA